VTKDVSSFDGWFDFNRDFANQGYPSSRLVIKIWENIDMDFFIEFINMHKDGI